MSRNSGSKPRFGTSGQSTHCASGSKPQHGVTGQSQGRSGDKPQHGTSGQRLAGGGGGSKGASKPVSFRKGS